ncbi:MAG: hypothetical protein K940chlam8_00238 [Chlamydiae bacterium]|nr:hypothetical protein [Chlamydiota bacterium]
MIFQRNIFAFIATILSLSTVILSIDDLDPKALVYQCASVTLGEYCEKGFKFLVTR